MIKSQRSVLDEDDLSLSHTHTQNPRINKRDHFYKNDTNQETEADN